MDLEVLGWDNFFEEQFQKIKKEDYFPARVIRIEKGSYTICNEDGVLFGKLSGTLRYNAHLKSNLPSVGDWVIIKKLTEVNEAIIYSILLRRNEFSRKAPISGGRKIGKIGGRETIIGGRTEKQVIAANLDLIFYIIGLDRDINFRLIERIITTCWESGIKLVIVLNKSDLKTKEEITNIEQNIQKISFDTPIHIISAIDHIGFTKLNCYFNKGITISLFGNSGVGKSTFINHFLNENSLLTNEVRGGDNKGRHTTTWRELIVLPEGGIVIDNPGIREMQVWATEDNVNKTFEEIEELSHLCKFKNCTHNGESGCAVREALHENRIDRLRYENYMKLHHETLYLLSRKRNLSKKENLRLKIEKKNKNMKI